jgi:hypothetical protein
VIDESRIVALLALKFRESIKNKPGVPTVLLNRTYCIDDLIHIVIKRVEILSASVNRSDSVEVRPDIVVEQELRTAKPRYE